MTDQKALEYLDSYPHSDRKDLSKVYPGAEDDGIGLLHKILVFNPFFRLSIDECIAHPFFDKVRKPAKEVISATPIAFDFEQEDLDTPRLRKLFIEEIMYYKEQRAKKS